MPIRLTQKTDRKHTKKLMVMIEHKRPFPPFADLPARRSDSPQIRVRELDSQRKPVHLRELAQMKTVPRIVDEQMFHTIWQEWRQTSALAQGLSDHSTFVAWDACWRFRPHRDYAMGMSHSNAGTLWHGWLAKTKCTIFTCSRCHDSGLNHVNREIVERNGKWNRWTWSEKTINIGWLALGL
jgi:hypothetical protein